MQSTDFEIISLPGCCDPYHAHAHNVGLAYVLVAFEDDWAFFVAHNVQITCNDDADTSLLP